MKYAILILLLFHQLSGTAQGNLFQDAKGESALKLSGNSVTVNTADNSINLAAGRYKRSGSTAFKDLFRRWAVTLELKSNEGIANFKDGDNYLIDGSVGFYYALKRTDKAKDTGDAQSNERFVAANFGVDRNKLFNTSLPQDDVIFARGQGVYKVEVGQFGYHKDLLYGFTTSFRQQTNIDQLTVKTIQFRSYLSPDNLTTVTDNKEAFDVTEFVRNQKVLSLNADLALLLNRKKAFGSGNDLPRFLAFHFRYQQIEARGGRLNPGIGFYLGKHGAPRTIIGGFNVQFSDLLNEADEEGTAWNRASLNLVVGFQLGN